jgi:hypothetical protein
VPQASHLGHTTGTNQGATSFNVTRPTGADVSGRLVMVFMNSDTGVVADMTLAAGTGAAWNVADPTGWALSNDAMKVRAFWKYTNGAEPATWTGGKQSSADTAWTAICAQDVDTSFSPQFTPTTLTQTTSSTTISLLGATPLSTDDLEYRVAFAMHGSATRTVSAIAGTPSFTLTTSVQSNNYSLQRAGYRQLASGSATSAGNATFSATTPNRFGLTVNLRSASAPPTEVNLGWASEEDHAYAPTVAMGLAVDLGWASEEDHAYAPTAEITIPVEANLDIAIEQDLAPGLTHRGGQPPPPPPPPPPRDTRDPRMPYVQCEIGFVTDASVQGYLVLDDPERGKLDVGKLAPGGGGASIGGEIFEDVSAYLSSLSTRQGATRVESPLIRYEAGEASCVLRNEDRRFDPTNLNGPYVSGSGSLDTSAETFVCTKGLLRTFGVTIGIRSHASTGPATLRNFTAQQHFGSSASLDKPPGTVSGDYMVAINLSDWGVAGDMGNPTGGASWGSPLVNQSYGTNRGHIKVWGKYADGSEPSTYGFTKHSTADSVLVVLTIRDVAAASTPVIEFDLVSNTALVDTPGITPLTPNDFEIRFAGGVASGGTLASWESPDGLGEIVDLDSNGYATGTVATRVLNAVGEGETQLVPMRPIRFLATWGSTTNMVPNPSMEEGSLTGWSGDGSSTLVASTTQSIYGRFSMRIDKLTDNAFHVVSATTQWTTGTAAEGDVVSASFWVYVPASAYDSLDAFLIRGIDEAGIESLAFGFVDKPVQADRWERIKATATVGSGKVVYGLQIQAWTDGGHAIGAIIGYLDGIQMVKGTKPEPFTNNSKRYPLWQGFVDDWEVAWDEGNGPNWSETSVGATDAFKVFEAVDRLPSAPAGGGEDTGSRLNRILDTVFWPNDLRIIEIGDSTLQETTLEGTVLNELQHALDSELGEGYMDSSGRFVFRNRNAVIEEERSTVPQAVFGDNYLNPQELPWESLGFATDTAQMVNKVSIARAGGVVQVIEDAASIARFLMKTHNREDLLLETDGEALAYANWIMALSNKPEQRFESMTINVLKDPWRLFPQVLERQIGDMIQVIRRPPGGGDPIVKNVIIRGIQHQVGQVSWKTTWQFQSGDKYSTVVPF